MTACLSCARAVHDPLHRDYDGKCPGCGVRQLAHMPAGEKTCTKCGERKPLSEFGFRTDRGMHLSRCRECVNYRVREKYDPAKGSVYTKRWRETHPEAVKERNSARDKKRMREMAAQWRAKNPEAALSQQRQGRTELVRWYVAKTLGITAAAVPPDLCELKREQLRLHRLAQELKRAIDERN